MQTRKALGGNVPSGGGGDCCLPSITQTSSCKEEALAAAPREAVGC